MRKEVMPWMFVGVVLWVRIGEVEDTTRYRSSWADTCGT